MIVKVKGDLVNVGLADIFRFYPWFKNVVEGLRSFKVHGESYRAEVERSLDKAAFEIEYVTSIFEENLEPYYRLEAKANHVRLWWKNVETVTINLHLGTVENLIDQFWDLKLSRDKTRFKDLGKIVEIVSYLRGKGFILAKYSAETLAKILRKMNARSFEVKLKLVIADAEKILSYEELLRGLANMSIDKGLVMEEVRGDKLFELFKKPLP